MSSAEECLKLVPRKYQEEIFEQARQENVIAALDTGSGKTLIAALLIKWVMTQPSLVGKKVVFLVPKVPLVDQQRSFLAQQTPLVVNGYTGAMGVESWEKERWTLEFAQSDCLVMTAQIFKNILVHGYWSLNQVSLLIFDECHHTQKNHPYRMIMADFYHLSSEKPKVFGMTASPIWNSRNPSDSIEALQANLSAKVVAVLEHTESLGQHVNRPTEAIVTFPSATEGRYETYYKPTLWEQLQSVDLDGIGQLSSRALQSRHKFTLDGVGPAGADYFLLMHAKKVAEEGRSLDTVAISSSTTAPQRRRSDSDRNGVDTGYRGALERLRSVVTSFERRLLSDRRALPSEWISPKLQAAIDILVKHRSQTFQGIVFVSQRQLVTALSWILGRMAETKDWIRCGELIGHGQGDSSALNIEGAKGMDIKSQRDVVQSFKAGKLNLLITTSVGEEGLDFPACELVVRYDPVQHMVGYVQSRGRARHHKSTYVVIINEDDSTEIARYQTFRTIEPELKAVFRNINVPRPPSSDQDALEGPDTAEVDPLDLASRESYVIPSTGATLTYSSAVSLLEYLCSLIPRDRYTPSLRPKYNGDFQATVWLPKVLPLPSDKRTFSGPLKRTKREAKRAVAFVAVRELHRLGVYDDHLSPIASQKGDTIKDADGRPISKVSDVAVMMDAFVVTPWKPGSPWYLFTISVMGVVRAGLVCGSTVPEVDLTVRGQYVQIRRHRSITHLDLTLAQLGLLEKFTRLGIRWCLTGSPIKSPLACYLVPLDDQGLIAWQAIKKAVTNEKGSSDWSAISEKVASKVLLANSRRTGRPLRFKGMRHDLSIHDKPPHSENTQEQYDTYFEYFENKYTVRIRKPEHLALFPRPSGRVIEVEGLQRYPSSTYDLGSHRTQMNQAHHSESASTFLLPESFCLWFALDTGMVEAFGVFPPVCQRLCDVFRARVAQRYLNLPRIPDNIMMEALTLPSVMKNFSNQRLETLGDSVLKLSVVVYIFNSFPTKHEGQLTALKSNSVSNRLLLARAKEAQLERFLTSEPRNLRTWPFVLPSDADSGSFHTDGEEVALARRRFPRRSLQDCMEATLGASFVAGGIDMALQAGTSLGLCFGGSVPWPERYPLFETVPPATIFRKLQDDLQYTFRNGNLLVEAVKHPSFDVNEGGSCYQRLEFLGDAVVELVVTTYLYNKFTDATSGQMSWARARAICNATLAALAVKRLSLHKYILANNIDLNLDIEKESGALMASPYDDVAINDWKYDPPKALADVFESVIGAMFVDCDYSYPTVVPIIERIMDDVLKLLHPHMPRGPVASLLEFVAKAGCRKAKFTKVQSNPHSGKRDSVVVSVHDQIIAGPIVAGNKTLAKGLVAEAAMNALQEETSQFFLAKICTCMRAEDGDGHEDEASDLPERNVREKDINIETFEGFAVAGRLRSEEVEEPDMEDGAMLDEDEDEDEKDELDRREVELLLATPTSVRSDLNCMDIS